MQLLEEVITRYHYSVAKIDTMVLLSWFQSKNYSRNLNYNSYNVISKHVKKNNL